MLKIYAISLLTLASFYAKCQCTADAGNDTLLCASNTYFQGYFWGGTH